MNLSFLFLSDAKLRQITARASVVVAAILVLAKLVAVFKTGSVALLSSLVDSGVDLIASLITAYGVAKAAKPPDRDHRFGHGKAEALAALSQAIFIAVSAGFLINEALQRFLHVEALHDEETGYIVMGVAIVLTALLLLLQSYTVARTKSLAIASDRLHYIGDILINMAVIVTLYAQNLFNVFWIDPLFAILIACGMFVGAYPIARKALDVLMDAERPEKEREEILSLARNVKGVFGVHDLRTRFDGERLFIGLHLEMDPDISLRNAQKITEKVTMLIQQRHEHADVQIRQDPVGLKEERLDVLIEKSEA